MRRRWVADLALYLPALLIAFVIWLIAKQGDTESRMVAAPVQLVGVPDNVEARLVPTNTVEVSLIFPKTFLKNVLEPGVIHVSLKTEGIESKAGVGSFRTLTYPVLPTMVGTGDLPPSVRVLGVVPENVTLEARLYTIEAEVNPRVAGTPDPGYELQGVKASPPKAVLTGPPQALAKLRAPSGRYVVDAAPVTIAGTNYVVSAVADLALPPGVKPVDPQASARVEVTADIREKVVTRVFKDVPIVYAPLRTNLKVTFQPATTNITVKGPRSKVESLSRDSFRFVPNAVPNEAVGATNILSFRIEPIEEGLSDDLMLESDVRTVTLLFEEKARPTPAPSSPGDLLNPLPEGETRGLPPLTPPVLPPASPAGTSSPGARGPLPGIPGTRAADSLTSPRVTGTSGRAGTP